MEARGFRAAARRTGARAPADARAHAHGRRPAPAPGLDHERRRRAAQRDRALRPMGRAGVHRAMVRHPARRRLHVRRRRGRRAPLLPVDRDPVQEGYLDEACTVVGYGYTLALARYRTSPTGSAGCVDQKYRVRRIVAPIATPTMIYGPNGTGAPCTGRVNASASAHWGTAESTATVDVRGLEVHGHRGRGWSVDRRDRRRRRRRRARRPAEHRAQRDLRRDLPRHRIPLPARRHAVLRPAFLLH